MNAELQEYYEQIVQCLVVYGHLNEEDARQRIDSSRIFNFDQSDPDEVDLFTHEVPYYYAMSLLHGNRDWIYDRKLWPPPRDYGRTIESYSGRILDAWPSRQRPGLTEIKVRRLHGQPEIKPAEIAHSTGAE